MTSDDSSEIPVNPASLKIFIENNEKVNKQTARNIPSRITGLFVFSDCSTNIKVDVIYLVRATVYQICRRMGDQRRREFLSCWLLLVPTLFREDHTTARLRKSYDSRGHTTAGLGNTNEGGWGRFYAVLFPSSYRLIMACMLSFNNPDASSKKLSLFFLDALLSVDFFMATLIPSMSLKNGGIFFS